MKISFQKKDGGQLIGVDYFWRMAIETDEPTKIRDSFVPELFYDFLYVQSGVVAYAETGDGHSNSLPQQSLKTLFTRGLSLSFAAPLVLYGARLSLSFAPTYWGESLAANQFVSTSWVTGEIESLAQFVEVVTAFVRERQISAEKPPLLSPQLIEAAWLAAYSARHRRRLYKATYGISRKEMQAIASLHAFLGHSCDFTLDNPNIIEHIDSDVFYDQPHLNHLFKRMTGLSPLAYFEASSLLQDNLMAASYNTD